jgi:hypothetical protein
VSEGSSTPTSTPAFLIVGTPRSGTTLIQRLASELEGVRVPPETHFFARFYPRLFRWRFPLAGDDLVHALDVFASTKRVAEAQLDVQRTVERLNGTASGPLQLFAAVIEEMSGGTARVYGEKTPVHLLWWRTLAAAVPTLRVLAVVRDPRAVIASWLATSWRPKRRDAYAQLAERWRFDQQQISKAAEVLGPKRCLVLRYEDVVADADSARASIATLLGIAHDAPLRAPQADQLFLSWETWKARAMQEVTTDRVDVWRSSLPEHQARRIEAICRGGMRRFGYPTEMSAARAAAIVATLPPRTSVALLISALQHRRELARIGRVPLY